MAFNTTYSFEALKPIHSYYHQWDDFQLKQSSSHFAWALLLLVYVPLWLPLCIWLLYYTENWVVAALVIIPPAIEYVGWIRPFLFWRCPRCRRPFFVKEVLDKTTWRSDCAHCGLPKYAPNVFC